MSGAAAFLLVASAACSTSDPDGGAPGGSAAPVDGGDRSAVSVVAVGDIVCEPDQDEFPVTDTTCQHAATADLTERLDPDLVIGLGDLQYEEGTPGQFAEAWNQTWGRFSDRIVTVPGNHEWRNDLSGWYDTFGAEMPAATRAGAWGIYLVDANCDRVDCGEQAAWLTEQLAADEGRCQLVAWHQPRTSSGIGPDESVDPLWQAAVSGRADISLVAHDHLYERFTRLGADLRFDDVGVRQFTVGTGGKSLYQFGETQPGSEARVADDFGVLQLTLEPDAYAWRFVDIDDTERDAGSDTCR